MPNRRTRDRFLDAAYAIVSEESLSQLSIERVSERAGVSRRTFFLHFSSKDELLGAMLEHVRPARALKYRAWSQGLSPDLDVEQRIEALFALFIADISRPGWNGCCFLRISAEFGELTGHPVHAVVIAAHRDMEMWFESELSMGRYPAPGLTVRQLTLMLNGLMLMQLRCDAGAHACQMTGAIVVQNSTRVRLLEAATRISLEESFSQLSIDRIAVRAGLSRRTFFLHFTCKDELLAEVITYLRPAYAERYRQWAEYLDSDLTVEERIYGLFRNLLEAISKPAWRGCCFLRISAELGDRQGHPVHAAVLCMLPDLLAAGRFAESGPAPLVSRLAAAE